MNKNYNVPKQEPCYRWEQIEREMQHFEDIKNTFGEITENINKFTLFLLQRKKPVILLDSEWRRTCKK